MKKLTFTTIKPLDIYPNIMLVCKPYNYSFLCPYCNSKLKKSKFFSVKHKGEVLRQTFKCKKCKIKEDLEVY